ncbi:ABC transporter ATP-binding protein [Staphylococcus massiliensis]|uniref:ABC transporter ATP-binding protein n=1 Tax=Staphylococcus massiliensis TaxID=555791 RepID=UPI001EE088ED|nr:ATP-binding cassette domain-containing protein [Staphylococcus massiliensis]MCG3398835.1 ATP-binding cassette domain-containing protein [Staphylococcus massiliensis]MCG3401396.1 ATP-binding cassette domain-containing protein [Staphylococcus massiliensis]MCG3411822.1 ATP-binding cassette domain-containing protein [Staphylococcus massiliensis]
MNHIINLSLNSKRFKKNNLTLLKSFNLEVDYGESISITGSSGVGKTTLLNIIGLVDSDFDGNYNLFGHNINGLSSKEKALLRNQKLGFILQESALINSLSIEKNIKLPYLYAKSNDVQNLIDHYNYVIEKVGIQGILKKKPLECSGGQRARASLARGLIMKPDLILADEPTSSLDEDTKARIVDLLFEMNREFRSTLITVTHELDLAHRHDRMITIVKDCSN